jgi:hypothetical protein
VKTTFGMSVWIIYLTILIACSHGENRIGKMTLHGAVTQSNNDVVELLLIKGADVNLKNKKIEPRWII